MFTNLAIYMLQKNLEEEAFRSHKLIYSLFLPTITRYLWEFDITGIKETLTNIIENNYKIKFIFMMLILFLLLIYIKIQKQEKFLILKIQNFRFK